MKVGIVGSGFVGSTAAYAMVMGRVGREIVLVDKNKIRNQAEANDISHAIPFARHLKVSAGSYADLKGSSVVIITAGVSQKPGETRLQLLQRNAAVFREIVPEVLKNAPDAILVIATNPVDVMTHLAARYAAEHGAPPGRVIGSGTMLDTARFRTLLGSHLGVDPQHVHGYVLGEHGDSEMFAWSLVTISGMALKYFCRMRGIKFDAEHRHQVEHDVRTAGYSILEGKGATYFGIGSALARLVEVILNDQRAILTVSTPCSADCGKQPVTISLPRLIGGAGVLATFPPLLSDREAEAFHTSENVIRAAIVEMDKAVG